MRSCLGYCTYFPGGTDIEVGVREARDLINAQDGTAAFMIVITDGNGGDPAPEADAARAEGTIVFAVGVGTYDKSLLGSPG